MPVIRVDDEVVAELKKLAVVYGLVFRTPNTVLRVVLGLDKPVVDAEEVADAQPN